jgi:hypothetical protein
MIIDRLFNIAYDDASKAAREAREARAAYIAALIVDKAEDEQPNPSHYPDTPEGDQDFHDDYWQGDIAAELYHFDMGDR